MRRLGAAIALVLVLVMWPAAAASANDGVVGPGDVHTVVRKEGDRVAVSITPNIGGLIESVYTVGLTRGGRPVAATVTARFTMIAMPMPTLSLAFRQVAPGSYRAKGEKLTMPGRWEIRVHVIPSGAKPFDVVLVDHAVTQ